MANLVPFAQGFKILGAPASVSQVYLHSIQIALASKALNFGISLFLCEINGGVPDVSRVLPNSIIHLAASQITPIGTTATRDTTKFTSFTFANPIPVLTSREYAILLRPDGNSTDYSVYTAVVGEKDLISTTSTIPTPPGQITLTQLYKGSSDSVWTATSGEFLQLIVNRYRFTANTATITFNAANNEYMTVANLTSTSIQVGDVVFSGNSTQVNTSIFGTVYYSNPDGGVVYLENTTGGFGVGNTIQIFRPNGEIYTNVAYANSTTGTRVANGTIKILNDLIYHIVSPRFMENTPAGTSINYSFAGITGGNGTYTTVGTNPAVINGVENTFNDVQRVIPAYSISKTTLPRKSSIQITATLQSNSDYTSPMLDQSLTQAMVITNHLDGTTVNTYSEYYNTGTISTKYISKPVVLATGQDAEDIKVYITAWRPPTTNIKMYAKFLSAQDPGSITDKAWTPLINDNTAVYSDALDDDNLIEYTYSLPNTINDPALYLRGTGVLSCNLTSNQVSPGVGTAFNTQLQPGQILYTTSNLVIGTVNAITNSTYLTLSANALVAITSNVFNYASSVIPPQTIAYLNLGNLVQKTGTINVFTSNATVMGVGTAFNTELAVSNYINVNGEQKYVVSIANSTSMTVDSPFLVANNGVNYSLVLPNGLTYTDGGGVTYVKYKTFQIKMTMHSDNPVFTPKVHDLRAIALQT